MAEKILLIDDEKDFVETLAARMRSRDMDVSTSTSAKEALAQFDTEAFDAVVLDLQMPDMDGLEALRRLKEKNPNIQVILLTGQATVEKGIQAMKLGALDLLEKPASIETLTEKIKAAKANKMVLVRAESEQKIKDIIGGKGW
ncbi:MAG: response regulator [Proteobacteria bacterium]|nr:response regulator [Desulfobulbaceae bacterium]MBU4152827.1 response regulator [Pseudomonadota bacterium]MDP2105372.1 response regulator [Desulfobulbaceae bacterium]